MKVFSLAIFLFLACGVNNDFYAIHFTTIDNEDRSLQEFRGKKIMVVILPVSQTADDSISLRSLVRIGEKYGDRISLIGIPSFEDGYSQADSNNVALYYRMKTGREITIAKGMHTRKTSGANQHPLFAWLTHADQNGHFDGDATGAGEKFFINENGELYAIISADGKLNNKLMDRMVNN